MIVYEFENLFRQDSVSRSILIGVSDFSGASFVLTNTDLIKGSLSIKDSLCSDTNLRFGKIEGAEFSFTTTKTDFDYIYSLISVRCRPNGATSDLDIPHGFIVIEEKYSSDKSRKFIRCVDLNYFLNKTDVSSWYNSLTFPMTLQQFRYSLFSSNPITVNGTPIPITQMYKGSPTLVNDSMTVNRTIAPNQLSMAEVLKAICEVNGVFGHFYYAYFLYIPLKKFSTGLYPANNLYPADDLYPEEPGTATSETDVIDIGENGNYINANFEDYYVKPIDKLQIRTEENDIGVIVGTGDNTYIVEDNFLLYGKGTAELTTIANNLLGQISGISYVPCNIEIKGNPCLQVGDAIRMKTKNGYIVSYIMQRTLSGTQFLRDKYTATGDEYYTEENVGYNYDIKKLRGKSNVLSRTIEETRSELSSFETNVHDNYSTTTEMNSAISQSANSILSTVSNTYTTQSTFTTTIDDLQDQIDNRRTTWGGDVVPTLNNPPANSWTTDVEKDRHINDLYVVSSQGGQYAGFEYRFEKINNVYQWSLVPDTVATQALAQSQQALDGLDDLIDEIDVNYYTKTETDSQISQTASGITSTVSATYETKADATAKLNTAKTYADGVGANAVTTADGNTDTKLGSYYNKTETDSQISQTATNITSSVSQTYETKTDATSKLNTAKSYADGVGTNAVTTADGHTDTKLNSYYTKTQTDSEISQSASDITLAVSQTYATITSLGDEVDRATTQESSLSSRIDINANAITTKVSANGVISAINQTSESVTIDASKINLNGAVTANTYFKINNDGSFEAIRGYVGDFLVSNGGLSYYGANGNAYIKVTDTGSAEEFQIYGTNMRIGSRTGTVGAFTLESNSDMASYSNGNITFTSNSLGSGITLTAHTGVQISANNNKITMNAKQGVAVYFSGAASGDDKMIIYGNCTAQSFTQASDRRLKKDIQQLSEAIINAIGNVELKQFVYDFPNKSDDTLSIGAIAQDVKEELENAGIDNCNIVSRYGEDNEYYALNYNEFLIARNAYLEKRVDDLEKRIEQLEQLLKGD